LSHGRSCEDAIDVDIIAIAKVRPCHGALLWVDVVALRGGRIVGGELKAICTRTQRRARLAESTLEFFLRRCG